LRFDGGRNIELKDWNEARKDVSKTGEGKREGEKRGEGRRGTRNDREC